MEKLVITLEDLLTHFGSEFRHTADTLKKFRDIPNYEYFDNDNKRLKIQSKKDLKSFLQSEIDAYQTVIDEMDRYELED